MSEAKEVINTAVKNQPQKRGCLRGCLITVLILALPFYWFCLHTTPLRVSKETTYVLGPMTSDGKRIDYFRAMEERYYPPEMKTDDNGYRLIVRACGVKIDAEKSNPESLRLQIYEKLGLDPNEKPTMQKIESPWRTLAEYDKNHPQEEREKTVQRQYQNRTIWTFDDFPMLQEWLDANTAGLDLLAEAMRKPAFCSPYIREHENTSIFESVGRFEAIQEMREWARAAQARANFRIGMGDIDGAIDDIVTIHHLGRHAGKQGTLVVGLVGIAIEGMARAIGIGDNPGFPPTKEQIERLVTELDALPPRWTFGECIESERYFGLAAMQDQYWGINPGFEENMLPSFFPLMSWTMDINIALERLNKVYDAITNPEIPFDEKELEELFGTSKSWNPLPLLFVRSRTERIMKTLVSLFVPAVQAGREAWRRMDCTENMQRLTLALLLYEKEHGQLPEGDWREAIRPYLGEHADRYFQCPSHRLAEGETNYAMIRDVPGLVSHIGNHPALSGTPPQEGNLGNSAAQNNFAQQNAHNSPPVEGGLSAQQKAGVVTSGIGNSNVPNLSPSPNQILLVEVREPQKLGEGDGRIPFDKATFEDGLGSKHAGGINVGHRSGAVRFIAENIKPEQLQSLLDGTP